MPFGEDLPLILGWPEGMNHSYIVPRIVGGESAAQGNGGAGADNEGAGAGIAEATAKNEGTGEKDGGIGEKIE